MTLKSFTCLRTGASAGDRHWKSQETEGGDTVGPTCMGRDSRVECENIRHVSSRREQGLGVSDRSQQSGSHVFSCFRPSAINLMANPVQISTYGQRKGGSTVMSEAAGASLPRTSFMDGAGDHQSWDDPTSPVVTCIGQVRVKPVKQIKTVERAMEEMDSIHQGRMKKLQRSACAPPVSPRMLHSKWKTLLGSKSTVNPTTQSPPELVHEIDLGRFSSTRSSTIAPALGDANGLAHSGTFFARSLMLLQLSCEGTKSNTVESDKGLSQTSSLRHCEGEVLKEASATSRSEEPLWKRRCGSRPLTLELKKEWSSAPPSLG